MSSSPRPGICIAVTGGIACGKTTVCNFFQAWGAEIWDADMEAHRLIAPGGAAVEPVLRTFGADLRDAHGGVNRPQLAKRVFADETALATLNALLHPPIIRASKEWARNIQCTPGARGVAAIPLFFECGMRPGPPWHTVLCLSSTRSTMLRRLLDRGLTEAEAMTRIDSQWPVGEKAARATALIENDGSLADLEAACRSFWNQLPAV